MDRRTRLVLNLLAELQRLTTDGSETAVRLTLRTATGDFIGDVTLPDMAAEALTDTVRALADMSEKPAALPYDTPVTFELPDPRVQADLAALKDDLTAWMGEGVAATAELDPLLIADLQDHFDGLDLITLTDDVLSAVAPADRMRATLAIDDVLGHIPTQDLDGDL